MIFKSNIPFSIQNILALQFNDIFQGACRNLKVLRSFQNLDKARQGCGGSMPLRANTKQLPDTLYQFLLALFNIVGI